MLESHTEDQALRDALVARLSAFLRRQLQRESPRTIHIADLYVQFMGRDWWDPTDDLPEGAVITDEGRLDTSEHYREWVEWFDFSADPEFEALLPKPRRLLLVEIQSRVSPPRGSIGSDVKVPLFHADEERILEDLGFEAPDLEENEPNWSVVAEGEQDVERVAAVLLRALVEACGIPLEVVDADLWLRLRRRRERALRFNPGEGPDEIVADPTGVPLDYESFAMIRRPQAMKDWPLSCEIEPAFFAIVAAADHSCVNDLVALAPVGPGDARVGWFRRARDGWVGDPTIARRLSQARPEELRAISAKVAATVEGDLKFR